MKPSYTKTKALMDKKGLRPADMSRETGLNLATTFTDWKSGKSSPKVEKLLPIARVWGVGVEELMEE